MVYMKMVNNRKTKKKEQTNKNKKKNSYFSKGQKILKSLLINVKQGGTLSM